MVAGLVISLKYHQFSTIQDFHKNTKDEVCSMCMTMIKHRLELFKNRAIKYGAYWINYNKRELNDMRSLIDIISINKRYFKKHLDEQRKGLLDAMSLGKGLKLHPR